MTTPADHLQLSKAQRDRLGLIAAALIAGGAGMPSAKEADVQGEWIDRILFARPDLFESVRLAASSSDDPQVALDRLGRDDAEVLDQIKYAIAAAYLINPRVRALLGYPGSVPEKQAAYPDEADAYLEDGILNAVIDRGPIYRPTPDTK